MVKPACLVIVLVARLALAAPAPAGDEDPSALEAHKACASGQVDKGIRILGEYLARTDDATAIYNMARCYQQNGVTDKALLQFHEYLRKVPNLPADERRQVDQYIAELEAQQRARPPAPAAPPPPVLSETAAPPEATEGRPRLRTAGLVLGGAGVVSAGLALVFGLQVNSTNSDLHGYQKQTMPSGAAFTPKMSDGSRAETREFVFIGLSAAALASGAACYFLGLPPSEKGRTALAPWLARGAGGLSLRGAY